MIPDSVLLEMQEDIDKYGEGVVGEHAEKLLAEVKRLRSGQESDLDIYTKDQLVDELMKRNTFQGVVIYGKGDVNNVAAGDGGIRVRASKGLAVWKVLAYVRGALEAFRKMWPAAVEQKFGPKPEESV
jgi:hypothetical protein